METYLDARYTTAHNYAHEKFSVEFTTFKKQSIKTEIRVTSFYVKIEC